MTVPPVVHEVLGSPGATLDPKTRAFFEPRFGHDFSRVRVHHDARAAHSARAIGARAYTVGADIVFGRGEYDPFSPRGARLLAHELAHVVQQSAAPGRANQLQQQDTGDGSADTSAAQPDTSGPQQGLAALIATLRNTIASQGIDPSAEPDATAAPDTAAGLLQTLAILEALLANGTPDQQQAVLDRIQQPGPMTGNAPMAQQKPVAITAPGDPLEQEADAVVESVFTSAWNVPRITIAPGGGDAANVQRQAETWPLVECGPWCWAILAAIVIAEGIATYMATRKKGSACSCVCYRAGVGPNPIGQRSGPWQCQQDCLTAGYNGYRCGGDVIWS
jgi:hypothetical protein